MAIVFRNGKVILGNGDFFDNGYVVVESNRVADAGPGSGPSFGEGNETVDLGGKTILPGMIDCHVHLCLDGTADPVTSARKCTLSMITLRAARFALLSLLAGITTVRDLGAVDGVAVSLRDAVDQGIVTGPRIVSCNQAVCITGGQGWEFSRQADGVDDVRKAVREQLRAGAGAIKMMATGGVMTPGIEPGSPQFTLEELKAGAEETHKAGRKIASHAQGNEGIKNSLRADFDTIEHGIYLDDEAIELLLEKKATLVPTLAAPHNIMANKDRGIPAFVIEKTRLVQDAHVASAGRAHAAGVTIAVGSDSGTPFNRHGGNMKEMELLVGVGMSPMDVIRSATSIAAETVGLGGRVGVIEKGKLADLIVVDGDPLSDITIFQKQEKIAAIMKDGVFYKKTF